MSQTSAEPDSRPRVHVVAAVASNGVIGARGGLPWHLPEDLKHFKAITYGHPVIMGRRTWDSLGKPLPGRENIVVTRSPTLHVPGASIAASLEAALALCSRATVAFVIGGGELYAAALRYADVLALTEIQRDFEGDARFPALDRAAWREAERVPHATAEGMRYDFVRYERLRREEIGATSRH